MVALHMETLGTSCWSTPTMVHLRLSSVLLMLQLLARILSDSGSPCLESLMLFAKFTPSHRRSRRMQRRCSMGSFASSLLLPGLTFFSQLASRYQAREYTGVKWLRRWRIRIQACRLGFGTLSQSQSQGEEPLQRSHFRQRRRRNARIW